MKWIMWGGITLKRILIIGNSEEFTNKFEPILEDVYDVTAQVTIKDGITSALKNQHNIIIIESYMLVEILSSVVPSQAILVINDDITKENEIEILENDNAYYIREDVDRDVLFKYIDRIITNYERKSEDKVMLYGCDEEITIDLLYRNVTVQGEKISLTTKEFVLLSLFLVNKNTVLSREEIGNSVWKFEKVPNSRSIDILIVKLRKKIGINHIVSRRGVGYVWVE